MKAIIGEFLGTMILVLLGDGACCNTWLTGSGMKSKNNTQLIIGWGAAVMLPAFIFGDISGSHFNPAITIASAIRGAFPWSQVPGYIIAQLLGGFCGAVLLMIIFHDHIKQTKDDFMIRGCFCTSPSIPNAPLNFLGEFVATFVLVFALTSVPAAAEASGVKWVFVYTTITAMVATFGGVTGAALNAARDLMPRIAYALFAPDQGKKDADWGYAWIPVAAPICGAIAATLVWLLIFE